MDSQYLTVPYLTTKELKRIFSKICILPELQHNGTPCWIWHGNRIGGYAQIKRKGVSLYTHRYLFAWAVHPLPRGKGPQIPQLDHLCNRPSCVNPVHLELVSPRVNIMRSTGVAAVNANKTVCVNGHKLEGDNVIQMKAGRQCRTCKTEWGLRHYRDHKNQVNARHREYYQTNRVSITARRLKLKHEKSVR